ncbi:MAG TPA: DUF5995 family protein [Lacibacter sp.]|nr:DUF5995 family protein [Lacibacter sp.]HMO90330.1 DUF5995 family protein [Lacibacter sp.]HMP88059.1 DUF5995 family protein [Lacibacter sp.]
MLVTLRLPAQYPGAQAVYDTLAAIRQQPGISSHFAVLYTSTYARINAYAATQPAIKRDFLMQFQQSFGEWFLEAHYAYLHKKPIPWNWQRFFQYDTLQPLQYWFLGINAHINGDMHQTLLSTFHRDTLRNHRLTISEMRKSLRPFFDSLYYAPTELKNFRRLHRVTLGMDRMAFRHTFFSWRQRQLRMITLYGSNRQRYEKKLARLQRIMLRWDNRAFNLLQ